MAVFESGKLFLFTQFDGFVYEQGCSSTTPLSHLHKAKAREQARACAQQQASVCDVNQCAFPSISLNDMKSLIKNTKLNQNKKEEKKYIVVGMGMCVLGTSWEEAKGGYPRAMRLRAVGVFQGMHSRGFKTSVQNIKVYSAAPFKKKCGSRQVVKV